MLPKSLNEVVDNLAPYIVTALTQAKDSMFAEEIRRELKKLLPGEEDLKFLTIVLHVLVHRKIIISETIPDPDPGHTRDRMLAASNLIGFDLEETMALFDQAPSEIAKYRVTVRG